MLSADDDGRWITSFYEYIEDKRAKEAFALLIGTFACLGKFRCGRKPQGEVRSVGIEVDGECLYTIIPAKKWVTFQWRPPVTRTKRFRVALLRNEFPEGFTDSAQKEHWSVRVACLEDALKLLRVLNVDSSLATERR